MYISIMKYKEGFKIGELEIIGYNKDQNFNQGRTSYLVRCSCKKELLFTSSQINRAIDQFNKINYVGCQNCKWMFLNKKKVSSDNKYQQIYARYKKTAIRRNIGFFYNT